MPEPWEVVNSLDHLLGEINAIAPNRKKTSDGAYGDDSHAARPSGHNPDESGNPEDHDADSINEVRARDFDKDLRRPGLTMEMIAQHLVHRCRTGQTTWIKYIIYNRRIWSASSGWVTRTYNGSNPHDKHMHVSSKPDTASENNTRSLGLASLVEEPDVELNDKIGNEQWPNRTVRDWANDTIAQRDVWVGDPKAPAVRADSPLGKLIAFVNDYPRLKAEIAGLTRAAGAEAAEVVPTAQQNAQAFIAELDAASPEQTAAALRAVLGDRAPEVGRLLAG